MSVALRDLQVGSTIKVNMIFCDVTLYVEQIEWDDRDQGRYFAQGRWSDWTPCSTTFTVISNGLPATA